MNRNLQGQTLNLAILQQHKLINWGILASLILAFMLSATSSFATCYGNVNDGGEIGSDQTFCAGTSVTLTNEELPNGGYGDLEYMWLSNTNGPETSGATAYASSSPTYETGNLTETTWFRRCSRRNGCSSWSYGESNWVKITIGNASNVNDGGEIGSDQTFCAGTSVTLTNEELPSGGYGNLEYLWLSNTSGPNTSGSSSSFSTSPTFNTGNLTETTWFRRCSRRTSCSSWNYGESNWVKITIGNAVFEHVDGVDESACAANDGKIITDPYINGGTELPYSVEYTYDGQVFSAGPYSQNQDNYITGLASGIYSNITIIDANGCSSVWANDITIAEYTNCLPTDCDDVLVSWDLDACQAYSGAYSYDEFTPTYTTNGDCGTVSATTVYRNNPNDYYHSCLQGTVGNAMCISGTHVNYVPTSSVHKLNFSVTLNQGTQVSGLSFFQKSEEYVLNNGQSSSILNNYLKKFSVRASINGTLVYQSDDNSTSQNNWELSLFNFTGISNFELTATTTIDFELVAYDPIGNNGSVRAWEIDEIKVLGCCAQSATVGDWVFNDANGNGIQEAGEYGLEGVSVMLINTDDNSSETTTTNQNGNYEFAGVAPGNYKVKFPETGSSNSLTYNLTLANQGNDEYKDSDPVAMNNGSGNAMTDVFVVNAGDVIDTIDAGYYIGSTIAGIAFIETDVDGLQNGTEMRLDGITVMLLDENGNMISSTTTANGGTYEFDNLAPGNYKIKFPEDATDGVADYSLTRAEIGSDDDVDSDAVPMNDGSGNAMTQIVYVQNGATVDNLDAGYFPLAKIGDRVFQDVNENGIQDNDDVPYTNVNIMLLGNDVFGNIVNESTTPNANGIYEFANVTPGTYELKFTSNQITFIPTIKDFSGNGFDNDDSDIYPINGRTDVITVNAGDDNKTIDAGFKFDASLPVELLSFEAQLVNGNQVLLKWATASEINNRHFVVERSIDGNDFRPVGVVEGNGTTNLVNHYSLDDLDPFYGANYYRLKQVDFNGDTEYSNIETVIVSGNDLPDVIVYPNPVIKTTTLRVVTPFETDAQIEIVNQAGQVIKKLTMEAGANSKQIDLSSYAAGIYFAYINYNGHRTLVYNIVKVDE